ncbi:uncharacterized protein METZ01_LOCUS213693, partial [marine metagenome]
IIATTNRAIIIMQLLLVLHILDS